MERESKRQSALLRKKNFKRNGLGVLPVVIFLAELLKDRIQIIMVN
jgi:hypothetical protein